MLLTDTGFRLLINNHWKQNRTSVTYFSAPGDTIGRRKTTTDEQDSNLRHFPIQDLSSGIWAIFRGNPSSPSDITLSFRICHFSQHYKFLPHFDSLCVQYVTSLHLGLSHFLIIFRLLYSVRQFTIESGFRFMEDLLVS